MVTSEITAASRNTEELPGIFRLFYKNPAYVPTQESRDRTVAEYRKNREVSVLASFANVLLLIFFAAAFTLLICRPLSLRCRPAIPQPMPLSF